MMKVLIAMAALAVSLPSHAYLRDVPGTDYNYDDVTRLYWRDVSATQGLSFDEAAIAGWRHATAQELTTLFAANLIPSNFSSPDPIFFPNPPGEDFNLPGGSSGAIAIRNILAEKVGGFTSFDEGRRNAVVGAFDRPLLGGGYALAFIETAYPDSSARVGVSLLEGFPQDRVGHWLVSSTAPIPEPASWALMGMGVLAFLAAKRRRY